VACNSEKKTVGTGLFGLIANIGITIYKGTQRTLTVANPFSLLGAILRELAALENLERCMELQGLDVDRLRQQREQLQREVEELNRKLEQQGAMQQ
jgi:hypothetical protein